MKFAKKTGIMCGILLVSVVMLASVGAWYASANSDRCSHAAFCLAPKVSAPVETVRSVTLPKIAVPSWLGSEVGP